MAGVTIGSGLRVSEQRRLARIRKQWNQPDKPQNVTINYNAPITIHGTGDNLEHRLAAIHRRHIDQMKRDLSEVTYLSNRASFDGARSI